MQMDGSTEAAVAVRILQQQGFAVVGAVVRLAPEQAEAAQRAKKPPRRWVSSASC